MVSPLCLSDFKLSDVSLLVSPRYSLVVDEDVKKSNKQATLVSILSCSNSSRDVLF